MGKIITITHQKGGVGKTTLAINLVHAFKAYSKVALVDIDHQGSARAIIENTEFEGANLEETLDRADDYQVVFVDTPPYLTQELIEIYVASDMILIPTKTSLMDLMAIQNTLTLIRKAKERKPDLKALIVFNMVNKTTSLTPVALETAESFGFPVAKTMITERVSYMRSVALANGIYETGDKKAIAEFDSLTKEILLNLQ